VAGRSIQGQQFAGVDKDMVERVVTGGGGRDGAVADPRLVVLTTAAFTGTVATFLNGPGPDWHGRVRTIPYESIRQGDELPTGTYVFADCERLSPHGTIHASTIASHLAARSGTRLLNHPVRSMRRFELLRSLYEDGVNPFNVYRATECRRSVRYPVFLRRDDGHEGPITGLIRTESVLERALRGLLDQPYRRDTILIVEFADTRSPDGFYRKRSIWRIGWHYFAAHIHTGADWNVKVAGEIDRAHVDRERDFFLSPDLEAVAAPLFERARIDFGRIDFAERNGAPVVWEINTNPEWWAKTYDLPERRELGRMFQARLTGAMCALLGLGASVGQDGTGERPGSSRIPTRGMPQ